MRTKIFAIVMLLSTASFANCVQSSDADVPMSARIVYPEADPWRIITETPLEVSDILEMPNRREVLIKDKKWLRKLSKISELQSHKSGEQVQSGEIIQRKDVVPLRLVTKKMEKNTAYDYYLAMENPDYKTSAKFVVLMQYIDKVDTVSLSDWERVAIRYNDSFVWDKKYYCDVIAIACRYDKSLKKQARLHYYDGGYHIMTK